MADVFHKLCFARYAMGTRFEAVLCGNRERELRAAGEAALDEIEYYDAALDLFRKDSFLSFLNARASEGPVRVDGDLFDLLELCRRVSRASGGAFDITVGPLMSCWGFHGSGDPGVPNPERLRRTLEGVGFEHLALDGERRTVRFLKPGMKLDLGAVAKGFALDRAAGLLRESEVTAALLHGGSSTVLAMGSPPSPSSWKVGVEDPGCSGKLLKVVELENTALSVSAPHGRAFEHRGEALGHVMDPSTGAPAGAAALAAVVTPSAAMADAWSTAFLAGGPGRFDRLIKGAGALTALLCRPGEEGLQCEVKGFHPEIFKEPGQGPGEEETEHDQT